jgi:RNA polymerase sigma factor (TIGR02999 family)
MGSAPSRDITALLDRWNAGDVLAREELIPIVYRELRQVARRALAAERPCHTLQSTALVHEAYLRLAGQDRPHWQNRQHFFAVAAQLMRRVLVDHARKRLAAKRGGHAVALELDASVALPERQSVDLVALDDALNALAALDPRQCRVVELRFFGGLTIDEAARVMGLSAGTVKREWATARAWLSAELLRSSP